MAIIQIHDGKCGRIRQGDLVFHWNPNGQRFPLHVGIYIEPDKEITPSTQIRVRSLPGAPGSNLLGDAYWGADEHYHVSIIGSYRADVDPTQLKRAVFVSQQHLAESSQLPSDRCCEWSLSLHISRTALGASPRFISGTCSQFVEWLYKEVGLQLVDQLDTFDPECPPRLSPATQIRAFWKEQYPLAEGVWRPRFAQYPECLT
jgi:hypothetical protein